MAADFVLDGDRIRIADAVLVYLERTRVQPGGVVPLGVVPRPYGALPLAIAQAENVSREITAPEMASPEMASPDSATGAGPGGIASGQVVVAPGLPGEAIWLGFQAVDPGSPVTVRIRIDEPQYLDAITGAVWDDIPRENPPNFLVCPPDSSLTGRPVSGGRRMFGSVGLERFTLFVRESGGGAAGSESAVTVQLVPPELFARSSGRTVLPLDPDAGFTDRRLP